MGHAGNFRAGLSDVAHEVDQIAIELAEQSRQLELNGATTATASPDQLRQLGVRTHRQTQRMIGLRRRIEKLADDI